MITFIESGNRIATENFETGKIYTITYTNGNYRTMCCIGIGTDFVMFQGTSPNALFCLTLGTAETVSTIELGGGGSGTMNYNELENKPQINGIVLIGNKTASDLNLVSQNDLDNYVTDTELSTELADYATNASVVSALASKQDTLTTTQLNAVNSGITSSLVSQITTNQNNILTLQQRTGKVSANQSIGTDYTLVSNVSFHAGAAKTILMTAALQFNNEPPRGIIISKSNNRSNFNNGANLIAKAETTESINILSVTGIGVASADTTYYVWAKSAGESNNAVYLTYQDFTS